MIILDTDIFSLAELTDSREYARVRARIAQLDPPEAVATTIITCEEQARGRLARIASARGEKALVDAYSHYRRHIQIYQRIPVMDFDDAAVRVASDLSRRKIRIGTLDLRIAAICLSRGAILLSRNLIDFRKVPNLRVEDWTI